MCARESLVIKRDITIRKKRQQKKTTTQFVMITEMARKFFAFFSVLYCGRVMNESAWDTLVDTHKILFVYGCELSRIALNSESEDEHQKRTIRHMMSSSEKISFHRMLDDDEI